MLDRADLPPRVLVFQHGAYCPLGMLGEHLASDGVHPVIVELDRGDAIPQLESFDVLMVMGGAMDVWEEEANPWLVPEKAAIRKWVADLDRPYLGVCLGHQLLAEALGGRVERTQRPEAALLEIQISEPGQQHPFYAGFGPSTRVVQWHGAEVTAPPPGSVVLAYTADCPVSAFGAGSAAFGVQYHVEATHQSISEWMAVPASASLPIRLHGPDAGERMVADVAAAKDELRINARRLYDNFMGVVRRSTRKRETG